jgi:MFS transporter, SP family, sugar:H+ symporter
LYLSEMAPPRHRGAVNNGFAVSVGLGKLMANLINYNTEKLHSDKSWRLSLLLGAIPALVLSLGVLFVSETPNSLIQRTNDMEKARKVLQKIRGTIDVSEELNDIASAGKSSNSHAIMQRKYGPPVIITLFLAFFQRATGINVITIYSPIIFRTIGFGESSSLLSTVIIGAISTCTIFISMAVVDRLGRRILFIIGGITMFLTHITVGIVLATELGDYGGIHQGYAYTVLVLICVYVAGFGISWGPLSWLVPSEILPLEIRSIGQSLFVAIGLFFAFLLAQLLLFLLCHMKSGVFFFFGGWVLLMTVFVMALLPETKNLPIEKVQTVWHMHWFWKNFVGGQKGETEINEATL